MNRFETSLYQVITNVTFVKDTLVVTFADGNRVSVSPKKLEPKDYDDIDWSSAYHDDYSIHVPHGSDTVLIPWDMIRLESDPDFSQYMVNKAEQQAKLVGSRIRTLRENKGIKSQELAERAGITPQTVSRIENGKTDLTFATLRKILTAMGYSLRDLAKLEVEENSVSVIEDLTTVQKRLQDVGVEPKLFQRILPRRLYDLLINQKGGIPKLLVNELYSYLSRIFDWSIDELRNGGPLTLKDTPYDLAFYKTPSKFNLNQIKAYSHYAYYLARIVSKSGVSGKDEYPGDIDEFRSRYFEQYSSINFESLVRFLWNMDICVLPLNDSGLFHGASWNIEGRHVIILKQKNQSHARWIFDLLHEAYHVFVHLEEDNSSIIESEEMNPINRDQSTEESEANSFANQVIFGQSAEEIAIAAVKEAAYKTENLKRAVYKIAESENVRVDFIANYLGFRLALQGENWWGTVSTMQITDPHPLEIAQKILLEKVNIKNMDSIDYNMFQSALS